MTDPKPGAGVVAKTEPRAAMIPMKDRGIQLTSLEDAVRFCKYVAASGIGSGAGCDTPEKALILVQAGMEAGLSPMASFRALYVMDSQGRIALGWRGTGALAVIRRSGVCKVEPTPRWEGTEGEDDWTCIVRSQRNGWTRAEETTYSVADAKTAGLWGKKTRAGNPTPWILRPKMMLLWRAVGDHANTYYPDVLLGYPLLEVLRDDVDLSDPNPPRGPAARGRGPGRDPLLEAAGGRVLDVTPSAGPGHPSIATEANCSDSEANPGPAPLPDDELELPAADDEAPELEPQLEEELEAPEAAKPAPPPASWREDPRFNRKGDDGPMEAHEQTRLMELLKSRKVGAGRSAAFLSRIIGRELSRPGMLTRGEFYYVVAALEPGSLPKDRQPEQTELWR